MTSWRRHPGPNGRKSSLCQIASPDGPWDFLGEAAMRAGILLKDYRYFLSRSES